MSAGHDPDDALGKITHYYSHLSVAAITLSEPLAVGDRIDREALLERLVAMGFDYLKLDFTFAPAVDGRWHDPTRTPAERFRAGYAAIRRGAGDGTFVLCCGVPLPTVEGLVDGCRIEIDLVGVVK